MLDTGVGVIATQWTTAKETGGSVRTEAAGVVDAHACLYRTDRFSTGDPTAIARTLKYPTTRVNPSTAWRTFSIRAPLSAEQILEKPSQPSSVYRLRKYNNDERKDLFNKTVHSSTAAYVTA